VNSPVLDLATLPATPQQRRAALVTIASLGVVAIAAAPFSRHVIGTFPGFVTLYGGAVLMGLSVTAMILFAQFALSRKPSLLALACGTTFSALVFIPYLLTFSGINQSKLFGGDINASTYLWALWHSALPASYVGYVLITAVEGTQRVRTARAVSCVVLTFMAAAALTYAVYVWHDLLPPLTRDGHYLFPLYVVLGIVGLLSAAAFVLLLWGTRTVIDAWLSVPATAFLLESVLNAFGGAQYSVGWYLSRADVLIATAFLVIALLYETNRLARFLSASERRLSGLISGVADALIIVDSRGLVASINPAGASLFGFDADALAGTPLSRLLPEYDLVTPLYANVVETTGRDRSGNTFPIEFARGATRDLGEAVIIVRDITQRKRAEEAIHAAHDRAVRSGAGQGAVPRHDEP
jgi:PAS domain S-box-containing protein